MPSPVKCMRIICGFISFYLTSEVFAGSDRKQFNTVTSSEEIHQLRRNELFFKATFTLSS